MLQQDFNDESETCLLSIAYAKHFDSIRKWTLLTSQVQHYYCLWKRIFSCWAPPVFPAVEAEDTKEVLAEKVKKWICRAMWVKEDKVAIYRFSNSFDYWIKSISKSNWTFDVIIFTEVLQFKSIYPYSLRAYLCVYFYHVNVKSSARQIIASINAHTPFRRSCQYCLFSMRKTQQTMDWSRACNLYMPQLRSPIQAT